MFKKLLKPKIIPHLGDIVDAFFTTLPFFGIYSSLTMTIVLYTSVSEWLLAWCPWMNLYIFILIMGFLLGLIVVVAHKVIVPSLWYARSRRLYHLEDKLDTFMSNMTTTQKTTDGGVCVAVSGGFDPVHPGHLSYIEEALKLGDRILIILTRDDQLIEKDKLLGSVKGRDPIPYDVRKAILEWGLKGRGKVVENIDKDITSCESIKKYHPDIFAKGGNTWDDGNLPEKAICDELGIKIVFGIGGYDKPYSSSQLGKGR